MYQASTEAGEVSLLEIMQRVHILKGNHERYLADMNRFIGSKESSLRPPHILYTPVAVGH